MKSKKKMVYVLRTVNRDGNAYGGFQWPKKGLVKAPDWDPRPVCGGGLHGLLKGEGDASAIPSDAGRIWQVVEVQEDLIVQLDRKVKFPQGRLVFSGDRKGATDLIREKHPDAICHYGTATAGYRGTATAGYGGTATAGVNGTATAGYYGTATAGDYGTATAGDRGTATAGNGGTATAGYRGTATAGDSGIIQVRHYDGSRYRLVTGYVGEGGILPNVPYHLQNGILVRK